MNDNQMVRYINGGAEAINSGDWEAYAELYAPDLIMVTPGVPGQTIGREVRVQLAQGLVNAFPDAKVEPLRSFGQGEWACIEVLFRGTHTGPMPGPNGAEMPPTNKAVEFPYCMVVKFNDEGQCSELYEYYDQLSLLSQLGLV